MKNLAKKTVSLVIASFVVGLGITGALILQESNNEIDIDEKCKIGKAPCIPEAGALPPTEFTEKGWYKVSIILEIVNDPIIQEALKKSNEEFSLMSSEVLQKWRTDKEKEWVSARLPTPFMLSIINNDVADFLRDDLVIQSEEFGEIVFGEHILTNLEGLNVAVTIRTDNYDQSNDDWWQLAKNVELLVRECDWDESAQIFSEDVVIKIVNENEEFTGIMNSATPCNVLKEGISEFP